MRYTLTSVFNSASSPPLTNSKLDAPIGHLPLETECTCQDVGFFVIFAALDNWFSFSFWLLWVFLAPPRLSLVVASRGYSSLQCAGFSLWWLLLLWSTGSRHVGFSNYGVRASVVVARRLWSAGSVVVAYGLSCSAACEIFPDQGLNPCPLHWQADS